MNRIRVMAIQPVDQFLDKSGFCGYIGDEQILCLKSPEDIFICTTANAISCNHSAIFDIFGGFDDLVYVFVLFLHGYQSFLSHLDKIEANE